MKTFFGTWTVFLFSWAALSAPAQQPLASLPANQQLVTHSADSDANPRQLLLDAVVTDKSGKPVAGLQKQDFTVLDNKNPTNILSFHAHSAAATPAGDVDASTEIIFIFDEANTTYDRVVYAREGIENYLKQNNGQLGHPVSLGLFTDSGLQLQTQPSINGSDLAAALEQQGRSYRAVASGAVGGDFQRLQLSLNALKTLVTQEQSKPGRKMVIWVSPGWPLISGPRETLTSKQEQQVYDTVVGLSSDLRQARITLYSVDSLGAAGTGERSVFYENFTKGLTKPDNAAFGDLGLPVLVTQTGGRAIFGNDSIANSINHFVADLGAFYTLTVEAASADHPNQFHELTVKVATPGLKVRTRNGYYTQP